MNDLNVLTRLIKKLNLEAVYDIVKIDFSSKSWQITLNILEGLQWIEKQSVFIDNQISHYFALTCTQVYTDEKVIALIMFMEEFVYWDCFMQEIGGWLVPGCPWNFDWIIYFFGRKFKV